MEETTIAQIQFWGMDVEVDRMERQNTTRNEKRDVLVEVNSKGEPAIDGGGRSRF